MQAYRTLKNTLQEQHIIHFRIIVAVFAMLALLLVIVTRFYILQIKHYETYQTRSESNRVHLLRVPPKRGLIFDREKRLVAENIPSYMLAIVRDRAGDVDTVLEQLNALELLDEDAIKRYQKRKKRYRSFEPVPLRFNLNDEEIARLAANRIRLPGVELKVSLMRYYPEADLLAHTLGYVGRINEQELEKLDADNYGATNYIGKLGVEKYYEQYLHGQVGYEYVETDAQGRVLRTLERDDPISGANLILHLDLDVQRAAFDALKGRRGALVALDVKTGGVIAAVSTPSFNPNLFVKGISHKDYNALRDDLDLPLFNRFLQAQYPPGSTIKPIMSLAGLEEKVFTRQTRVKDPGWFKLPNDKRLYRDWKREGHAETVGFITALEESCDVYYYELAYQMGISRVHKYYDSFGLGKKTGVDLPGERKGLNPSSVWKRNTGRGSWYAGDTLNIGIGQGFLLATPLQLAFATNIIANQGTKVVPKVVASIDQIQQPSHFFSPLVAVKQHWEWVLDGMKAVVHGKKGTAKVIRRKLNYKIAGKTGTAQVVGIAQGEKYDAESLLERQRDHALFVGFAPADKPLISVAVIVENGEHGSTTAAPIVRKVMDVWINKHDAKAVQ